LSGLKGIRIGILSSFMLFDLRFVKRVFEYNWSIDYTMRRNKSEAQDNLEQNPKSRATLLTMVRSFI
jgi:hypothetical protein